MMQLEASLIASSDFTSGCESSKNSIAVAASSYLSNLEDFNQKSVRESKNKPLEGILVGSSEDSYFGIIHFPILLPFFNELVNFGFL